MSSVRAAWVGAGVCAALVACGGEGTGGEDKGPEPTPEPVDQIVSNNQPWLDLILDDGYAGLGEAGAVDVPTPGPDLETLPPPTEAPSSTAPTGGDGDTLQVLEPPPSQGLVDTIVGDVVASFLGK